MYDTSVDKAGNPLKNPVKALTCIYAASEINEYEGDPLCSSGVGLSVTAGTSKAIEETYREVNPKTGTATGPQFKITAPGFIPHWPGTYELAYTVYDGCRAPVTTFVKVNAQCSSSGVQLPRLPDVNAAFDCRNPVYKTYEGGFTAVSLQGHRTPGDLKNLPDGMNRVAANWSSVQKGLPRDHHGWKTPSCDIPAPLTPSTCFQWSIDTYQKTLLPKGESVESCCKCVFGSGPTVNNYITPGSSTSGNNHVNPQGRSGLEAITETEGSNLSLLLGLIIPLGLLLVFSVALNVYLLNDSRRKSPQLRGDSSNRDVELSIAPSRGV